ncbi:GNAT family N-acetyltransferase [Lentibacter algarum]|uniref:GNAT family N-acetyltransferase n=1 Tax=Lentibacter algarum TaxID=576131 RepID=UPI001C087377|nr:GNAT family N-acyltransferase [Lentibacter algarum]MBU2982398.1 GNAT family N-acetyltransferase [Lentibacter algarum]
MSTPQFSVRLADCEADILAAQRLRYQVFVSELGADGPLVDHQNKLERDSFDVHSKHLLLIDETSAQVVGVYRLLDAEGAKAAGQFYSESEYDLSLLKASKRKLLELGRSCLHPDYRGGTGVFALWSALAAYVAEQGVELLFGVASFHGADIKKLAAPLSLLHHRHLAPENLRVTALGDPQQPMDLISELKLDRKAAMLEMPALIKAYLRLGGVVGEGAYIDHAFNTTDVCLVLDTEVMNSKHRKLYERRV